MEDDMTDKRELYRQQSRAWDAFMANATAQQKAKVTALIDDGHTRPEILEHFGKPTAMADAATGWDRAVASTNRRNGFSA
jgi:hypothetical protein